MKNRFIIFICILSVVFGNVVYAKSFSDVSDSEYSEAIDVVTSLGAMKGDDEGLFLPYDSMTRAEFAQLLYNIDNKEEENNNDSLFDSMFNQEESESYYFTDVADYHWAYDAITYVADRSYMVGIGDGTFMPDKQITLEEVLKVIIGRFGLDIDIYNLSFPDGVISKGASLGLLKNVSSSQGDAVKRGEIAQIIYNSLELEVANYTVNKNRPAYEFDEDKTVLSEVFNSVKLTGTVEMNDITGYFGKSSINKNQIMVGNEIINFDEDLAEVRNLIGHRVVVYYEVVEDESILKYYRLSNADKYVEIPANEDTEIRYSAGSLTYLTESGGKRSISFSNSTPVIYNGNAIGVYDKDNFEFQSGKICVIQNNSKADVIIIENYDTVYVSGTSREGDQNRVIYNNIISDDSVSKWEISDDSTVMIYDENGNITDFDALQKGDVLNVAKSDDFVKMYITRRVEEGEVSSVNLAENKVTVNDVEYEFCNEYRQSRDFTSIRVGDSVTLRLDYFGRVAWMDFQAVSEYDYGYIVKVYQDDDNENVYVKMFKPNGRFEEYLLKKSVKYTDEKGKSSTLKKDRITLPTGFCYYKLNSDGELSQLSKPLIDNSDSGDGYKILDITEAASKSCKFKASINSFGGKAYIDAKTVVMMVPADAKDYQNYMITNINSLVDGASYAVEAYTSKANSPYAETVVITNSAKKPVSTNNKTAVVKKMNIELDGDDNLIKKATVFFGGKDVDIVSEMDGNEKSAFDDVTYPGNTGTKYNVQEGDIIVYSTDVKGYVDNVYLIYSPQISYPGDDTQKGFLAGINTDKYYIAEQYVDIPGDVNNIYMVNSANDEVRNCNPYFIDGNNTLQSYAYRFYNYGFRFSVGYVYDFDGEYITITTQNMRKDTEYSKSGIPNDADVEEIDGKKCVGVYISETYKYNSIKEKVYADYSGKKVQASVLNEADIKSYRKNGNSCSKVLVKNQGGIAEQIVIFND